MGTRLRGYRPKARNELIIHKRQRCRSIYIDGTKIDDSTLWLLLRPSMD